MAGKTFQALVLVLGILQGCSEPPVLAKDDESIPADTLAKWLDYALSSDNGLWENDPAKRVSVMKVATYGGETELTLPFYIADFISVYGDTIYISDGFQEALIAMSSEGKVLWQAGQPGEGPGDFLMIGSTSRNGDLIGVCNNSLSRVDFLGIDGSFIGSIPVSGPQNIVMISDSSGFVASKSQPGGSIHYFEVASGITRSFGESQWEMFPNNYPRRDLFIVYHPMGRVACISQFEDNLFIYDIETGETIHSGSRRLPADPTSGSVERFYTVYATAFLGPDSMINIPIPNIMDNGKFMGSGGSRHSLVTIVDRYNWNGDYLDSYLLPDSMLEGIVYSDDLGFVASQWGTSEVHRYELLE
ncbi:hypothetical protein CSA37_05865 [Candidatus Fermentibacteria bacterium]|nr:MAG: hypothetical protein CSA37_05865 [Candidatus Fermentibacteria bacterium]